MSPGKSQISQSSFPEGGHLKHSNLLSKRHGESMPNSLQFETEEKKEKIMNEAINCIFNQLPEDMFKLNSLLMDLDKLYESQFSSTAWLEQLSKQDSKEPANDSNAAKYRFVIASAGKKFPASERDDKDEGKKKQKADPVRNGKQLLKCVCARHLIGPNGQPLEDGASHTCSGSYSFPSAINLFPWGTVVANEGLSKFIDRLRLIFVELSQHFVNINLGLSLMFPKTEDNENSNLSIEVLHKLMNLSLLDYLDFFESNVKNRASMVDLVATVPHFGESRRMLFEYDRNACVECQMLVRSIISQCGRLYDSLVKNFDMVLKAKEQSNQQTRPKSPDSSQSTPSDSFYS